MVDDYFLYYKTCFVCGRHVWFWRHRYAWNLLRRYQTKPVHARCYRKILRETTLTKEPS